MAGLIAMSGMYRRALLAKCIEMDTPVFAHYGGTGNGPKRATAWALADLTGHKCLGETSLGF